MPTPERYYREQIARHEAAEREAERQTRREWIRILALIALSTGLGLVGIAFAFHSYDVDRGWVYWWAGAFVWVTGVALTIISAYVRGVRRGDWQ